MKLCPTENDLQGLLADRLPDDVRASVETHIEACATCQRQLDALTQSAGLNLVASHASAERGPAFLERLQVQYPATLLNGTSEKSATLHFPEPPTERAPLGQVGDFDILEELGSGSFGWVFRARERSLNRIVALKVLKPEMTARPDAIMRFEREARKASLKHDHIVNVYRFEKPAGFPPYLVMEFVEGETLEAKVKRDGRLTPEEAAAIGRQVALGLAAAHEHGMVHRDIKPANILLDKNTGRARISDFGLARDIANESMAVTGAGELAGTAPYMSPEHFRAPEKVDGRSDVFSLGVVLYQLLTGQLPFKGSFLQIRSGILEDEPKSPRRLNDSIPVDLETITMACLEKDAQRRYSTAQAVAEDLRRYQNGEPILCRPTGRVERAVKWMYRKPAQAMLAGVGTITVIISAVLIAGFFVNAQLQAVNANLEVEKDKVQKANDKLTAEEAAVRRLNYVADMNLAHQAFQSDNFPLLGQYLDAYETSDLRGFEWHYLRWLANTGGRRIGPTAKVTVATFDSSGATLALGVKAGTEFQLQLWAAPTPEKPRGELLQQLGKQGSEIKDIVFHPKGNWLATSDRQGTLSIWDIKANQKIRDFAGNGPLAVSPDGETLAYVRLDGAVQRWSFAMKRDVGDGLRFDIAGDGVGSDKIKGREVNPRVPDKGKPRSEKGDEAKGPRSGGPKASTSPITQLTFSHDGQRLAAVGGIYAERGSLCVWDPKTGQQLALDGARPSDLLAGVAFSPDDETIAAAGYDHALRVWDMKTGGLRFNRIAHKLEVLSLAFSTDGKLLATGGWDKAVKIWNARTGEELRSLRGNRGIVEQVLFCPDVKTHGGDHLVSRTEAGELFWWNADDEQTARVTRHNAPVHALAFSPTGRYLASLDKFPMALIQELAPPYKRFELPVTSEGARGLFSRDEKTFITAGTDGTIQTWPFAFDGKAIDLLGKALITDRRIVTQLDGRLLVSPANPSAEKPLENLVPFGSPAPLSVVAVDPAGERLAFTVKGGVVLRQRDKESGDVTEQVLSLPGNALAFSPDGRLLAIGNQNNSILLWDIEAGAVRHTLTGHLCFVSCVAFSPDGRRLASGSEDWTVKVWDIEAGRATLTLSGHKGRIRDLAFSPDGKLLASASEDATVRVWPGVLEPAEERAERRDTSSPNKRVK